ncbi:MAG: extracellular solute-binding protein [Actinomycetales bacterium]|nr:MAG: extracellular solute-binding protein [Actinomycetales bacterium]
MKKIGLRRLSAIAAVSLSATVLSVMPAHAATTIKIITPNYTDAMPAYYADLNARFEAANPGIKVEHTNLSWDDILVKGRTLVATNSTPDIMNLNTFSDYAAQDLLYKATDIFDAKTLADFVPAFIDNSKYNGTAYAVPDLASARMFFYNKKILYTSGVNKVPTTWDEVTAAAKKIKAKYPNVYPIAIPLGSEEAQGEFAIWAGGNGGRYFDDASKKWVINSKANVETLKYLTGLVKAGLTQPSPASTNRTDAFKLFSQGKVGMINASVFFPSTLKDYKSKVDYGVAPFPHSATGKSITLGVQDYFMAFKKPGNADAVKAWMNFLFSPSNYAAFLKAAGGFIPATKSASSAVDSSLLPFINQLPNAIFYPGDLAAWPKVAGTITTQVGTGVIYDAKGVLDKIQKVAVAAGTK